MTSEQLAHKNLLNQGLELLNELEHESFEMMKTFENAEGESIYLGLALTGLICTLQAENLIHNLQSAKEKNETQMLTMFLKIINFLNQTNTIIHKKNEEYEQKQNKCLESTQHPIWERCFHN